MTAFQLVSDFHPRGDQPGAIRELERRVEDGTPQMVLLGVTGSGKTFTMAHLVASVQRPTLVLAPNKTLAGQLFGEFKALFPDNAVEYFVSYYDYYQPEAYIPASDTYIQKDSSINEMIDKLRHSATRSVLSRRDVLVVASVSCIFGLGAPEDYLAMRVDLETGSLVPRDKLLRDLVAMQYERNDVDFHRGVFRVRGDRVEIFPAYEEQRAIRVDFFGDEIDALCEFDPLQGTALRSQHRVTIYPASHYVTSRRTLKRATESILVELKDRLDALRAEQRLIECQRLEERTRFDLEMMLELGYCNGIENYSRHLTGRAPGEPPPTLLDYFPEDFLLLVDESHITIPQVRAMFRGDRSRKQTLVDYGFRLPSALDNRPLTFAEFEARQTQTVYVSATPAEFELQRAGPAVVELIVRPTGLIDPQIDVRPVRHQVDDLYAEIRGCCRREERVLITTLTKRMAEDLSEYYADLGLRVRYLHADIGTLERMDLIRDLRRGEFDVLIGINLLREGLDIPEVSLVAVLDADKEGFLRSARSLIQTCGRASRNVNGRVILYADTVTPAMRRAIDETRRRRKIQKEHNRRHGITPTTVRKQIAAGIDQALQAAGVGEAAGEVREAPAHFESLAELDERVHELEGRMKRAAADLEFERAAELRDEIRRLRETAVL